MHLGCSFALLEVNDVPLVRLCLPEPATPHIYPSLRISVDLSVWLTIYRSIHLSTYLSIYLSMYLSIYQILPFTPFICVHRLYTCCTRGHRGVHMYVYMYMYLCKYKYKYQKTYISMYVHVYVCISNLQVCINIHIPHAVQDLGFTPRCLISSLGSPAQAAQA